MSRCRWATPCAPAAPPRSWPSASLGWSTAIDNGAMSVLAPDIQDTLGVSDAVLGAIGGAFGVLFLLGSIPLSTLADRHPRKLIAAVSMAVWGVVVFLTGLVQSAFWLFIARLGTGISQSYALPVNAPAADGHLSDPGAVAGCSPPTASFEIAGRVIAPLYAGSIAGLVAGPESWRWVFCSLSLSAIPVVLGLPRIKEPRRGRNEMQAVLGQELAEDEGELPISLSVAFERLRKIRTFYFFLAGMAALGFALFSVPLFMNLYLEDELGLSAWERGVFGSLVVLPGIAALAIAAPRADRLFRRSPPAAVGFMGALDRRLRRVHRRRPLHAVGRAWSALFYAVGIAHVAGGLHRRRADHVVGDPVPPPLARHRDGGRLHLPLRRVLRRRAHRHAHRRLRPARRRSRSSCSRRPSSVAR